MLEMVYVGNKRLIGEVIGVNDQATTIQVYESTTGLCPGEPVEPTGAPMSATLGPGILSAGGAARPATGEGAPRRAHFSALCVPREPGGRTNLRRPSQLNWENVPARPRTPDFCTTMRAARPTAPSYCLAGIMPHGSSRGRQS